MSNRPSVHRITTSMVKYSGHCTVSMHAPSITHQNNQMLEEQIYNISLRTNYLKITKSHSPFNSHKLQEHYTLT